MVRRMSRAAFEQRSAEAAAWHEERKRWFAVREDGSRVAEGDRLTTFRGREVIFRMVTAHPEGSKEGQILIVDLTLSEGSALREREVYPSVCGLELRKSEQEQG